MTDMNSIKNLVFDLNAGKQSFDVEGKSFGRSDAVEALRQKLVEANGGSSTIDYKNLRRNKVEIFEIIEELVPTIVKEGLTGSEFFMNYVDYRNLALGDQNQFVIPDNSVFVVSELADGIATPRRQRIGSYTTKSVSTYNHSIRMYDEFSRFMSGRIDWNDLVNKVSQAFQRDIWDTIYSTFIGITSTTTGMTDTYIKTGSWDEDTLMALLEHVEAATGAQPAIFGTGSALRKAVSSVVSDEAKTSLYNTGFYGKFYGYPEFRIPQVHTIGTDTFKLSDNVLHVVAGNQKFVKFVTEGTDTMIEKDYTSNADMSVEYFMLEKYGCAAMFSGKSYGKFTIS